jgi:hypothetical protein
LRFTGTLHAVTVDLSGELDTDTETTHRLHWPAWRRRHQHRARQAHQRWNAYAEITP